MKRLIYILSVCGMLWDATCMAPVIEYADATTDTGFKQLMSNVEVGKAIIESILKIKINTIEQQSTALPPLKVGREKQTFMDYHVVTDAGEHIIVEMQVKRHAYFDERAVFYLASVFSGQIRTEDFKESDWYKKIKKVYAIQFVKYDSDRIRGISGDDPLLGRVSSNHMAEDQYMKHYVFKDKLSGQEIDCIQMIQVELPRADRILRLSPVYKNHFEVMEHNIGWWLSLINHSARYCSTDITDAPEIVQQGFKQLKYSEWNPEIQKEYEDDIVDREKYATVLAVERNEGREEGRAEGLAEGEIKGRLKAIIKYYFSKFKQEYDEHQGKVSLALGRKLKDIDTKTVEKALEKQSKGNRPIDKEKIALFIAYVEAAKERGEQAYTKEPSFLLDE